METPLVFDRDSFSSDSSAPGAKSPEERIRIRLAAEGYRHSNDNTNNSSNAPGNAIKYSDSDKSSRCSVREKRLVVFLVVAVVVIVALLVLLVLQMVMMKPPAKSCLTPECVETSALLLQKMDLTADPCEDFHQYVCGNYLETTIIPPDKPKWGAFNEVDQKNKGRIKRLLDLPGDTYQGSPSSAIHKAKVHYQACMNVSVSEDAGGTPALQLIKEMGSWPLTSGELSGTWDAENWDMMSALVYANLHSATPFFGFGVGQDELNSSANIIAIDQGGTIFGDRSFYLGDDKAKYHDAYVQYLIDVVELLRGEETQTGQQEQVEQMAEAMWEFESQLAEFQMPKEERTNYTEIYHKMTIANASQLIDKDVLDLGAFFNAVFNRTLPEDENVVVYNPVFLQNLSALIADYDESVLTSYIVWHVVRTTVPYLSSPYKQVRQNANSKLDGVDTMPPQWSVCVSTTESVMGLATGALYVDKYFSPDAKRHAKDMVRLIRETFKSSLPDVDWMDPITRSKAAEKADAIIEKIGYPDLIDDVHQLDQYYENLTVVENDSFRNMLNAVKFYTNRALAKLHAPVDKTEWHMSADEVNAYYNANNNEMVFPAGILQSPFYSPEFPMALNFGAIGMVIGHELTHGFDNTGSQFDKEGNLNDWWQRSSKNQFKTRTQCLTQQYNEYEVQKQHVNGETTLGENIADNGGLKTSYHAYMHWLKQHAGKDEGVDLPGLDLSPQQLYYVGFAQLWCTFKTPEFELQSLVTDPHSPAKYRIIGAVSNSEDFASAFSCPVNSPMNPEDKCTVW